MIQVVLVRAELNLEAILLSGNIFEVRCVKWLAIKKLCSANLPSCCHPINKKLATPLLPLISFSICLCLVLA